MAGVENDPVAELRDKYRNTPVAGIAASAPEHQLADEPLQPNPYAAEDRSAAAADWQPQPSEPQLPNWPGTSPPAAPHPQQAAPAASPPSPQLAATPPPPPGPAQPHVTPQQMPYPTTHQPQHPQHPQMHQPAPLPPQSAPAPFRPTQPAPPPPRVPQRQSQQRMTTGAWSAQGQVGRTADETRSERLGGRVESAQRGWRATVNRVLHTRLSKGSDEIEYDRRVSQLQRNFSRCKVIGVVSGKGSSGKTSVALNVGSTIVSKQRGAKVIAMSIDPLGNISERVRQVNNQAPHSVMSLADAGAETLASAPAVGTYLQTDHSGLLVLGSSVCDDADFLTPEGLERVIGALQEQFGLIILDFGLNLDSPTYHAGLQAVDQLVLAASTTPDSIDELHQLIKTLRAFGGKYTDLIPGAVVAFSQARPGKSNIDVSKERQTFIDAYGTPVITIPFDAHISEGGPMGLHLMDEQTRVRYVWLASEVMGRLPAD